MLLLEITSKSLVCFSILHYVDDFKLMMNSKSCYQSIIYPSIHIFTSLHACMHGLQITSKSQTFVLYITIILSASSCLEFLVSHSHIIISGHKSSGRSSQLQPSQALCTMQASNFITNIVDSAANQVKIRT